MDWMECLGIRRLVGSAHQCLAAVLLVYLCGFSVRATILRPNGAEHGVWQDNQVKYKKSIF